MSELSSQQKVPDTAMGLEYDFYKFFGLISLLVLSGVVTFAASTVSERFPGWFVLLAGILSIGSATVSFACQFEIVRLANMRQSRRMLTRHGLTALGGFFLAGMGMFFAIIVTLV